MKIAYPDIMQYAHLKIFKIDIFQNVCPPSNCVLVDEINEFKVLLLLIQLLKLLAQNKVTVTCTSQLNLLTQIGDEQLKPPWVETWVYIPIFLHTFLYFFQGLNLARNAFTLQNLLQGTTFLAVASSPLWAPALVGKKRRRRSSLQDGLLDQHHDLLENEILDFEAKILRRAVDDDDKEALETIVHRVVEEVMDRHKLDKNDIAIKSEIISRVSTDLRRYERKFIKATRSNNKKVYCIDYITFASIWFHDICKWIITPGNFYILRKLPLVNIFSE